MTHICVSKLTIIGSDNGLSPGRRQAIIWTNAGLLLIRTLGTYSSEILGKIHSFSFKKMHLKMSSAKGRLFSLGLNELTYTFQISSNWTIAYWCGELSQCTPCMSWTAVECRFIVQSLTARLFDGPLGSIPWGAYRIWGGLFMSLPSALVCLQ